MNRKVRHQVVAFAGFEADLTIGVLRRGGARVPLQDKVFRLLSVFLQHPGEIVNRDDLRRLLWPEGTHVDFDHNINNAVAKLRHALESGGELIETRGRHGYCLASAVRRVQHSQHNGNGENGRPRLAVLPLAALDGGAYENHLAVGLTEELIAGLGGHCPERLGVIARTSVLKYAGTIRSIAQIGRDLHVQFIIEGTVQLLSGRTHVSLRLIQIADQTQLWAAKFDHPADDLLMIQSAVAEQVISRVAGKILNDQTILTIDV